MEQLIQKQSEIGKDLDRLYTNFKKDPASRKTPEYLDKRLTTVEANWTAFKTNHQTLEQYKDDEPTHAYFTTNYYNEVNKLYEAFVAAIRKLIGEVPEPKAAQTEPNKPDFTLESNKEEIKGQSNDELIKILRRQQALTKIINRLLKEVQSRLTSEIGSSKAYCEYKINTLLKYQDELFTNNQEIWELTDEDEPYGYTEETYHQTDSWIQEAIIAMQEHIQSNQLSTSDSGAGSRNIRLPKISLPVFDGNYLQWTQFKDLYMQLIHTQDISDAEKMFYLMNNVTGEARGLIQHLSPTADNYADAWSMLCNRYDNERLLTTALLNKLLSQPSIQVESAAAVRSLHDITKECMMGIKNLGIDIDSWDPIIVHLLIKKLDKDTHTQYEQSLKDPRKNQSLNELLQFLEGRFQALEAVGMKKVMREKLGSKHNQPTRQVLVVTKDLENQCVLCRQHHQLYSCKVFLGKTPAQRRQVLKTNKLCWNCMRGGHAASSCSLRGCTKCSKKHNSLVHVEDKVRVQSKPAAPGETTSPLNTGSSTDPVALAAQQISTRDRYILLNTIRVKVVSGDGHELECRAILDSGSQLNCITQRLVQKLGLSRQKDILNIKGISNSDQYSHHRVNLNLRSLVTNFSMNMEAHVLNKITDHQPSRFLDISAWKIPKNIKLADPKFYQPQQIDLLIGAEHFYDTLSIGQIQLGKDMPTIQNTVFGWTIAGKVNNIQTSSPICGICTQVESNLEKQMEKFWQLEEIEGPTASLTNAETKCETHFNQTVQRDATGRFVVRLPFISDPTTLGESKEMALSRFRSVERKLKNNPSLQRDYTEFMHEYLHLGHMKERDISSVKKPYYFLPHHCVLKPESTSTKLRVVFDASAKTTHNVSLNDILNTGPKIQQELFSVLLRFRLPRYVFTADIEKMYRQILIHPDDRRYQLIWWRDTENQPLKCYELQTVTYGITTAPYLAIKCLQKLASENKEKFPLGSECLTNNFYVDDCMAGANTLRDAQDMQNQLIQIMQQANFRLRKWCANSDILLKDIPPEIRAPQLTIEDDNDCHIKTLGLIWSPKTDNFQITISTEPELTKVTKRAILSEIAHLFDPLGMICPVVITAKIILQCLWCLKLDWDAAVPMEIHTRWVNFRKGLKCLQEVKIPRHVVGGTAVTNLQLHIFCDASEKAYGAVVYVRSHHEDGIIRIRMLCAKSKVAPLKKTTIPRLELCSAKLAVSLLQRVKADLHWTDKIFLWTDSTTVLGWINATASKYLPFVANRISFIQETTMPSQWKYVSTKDNPADLASRGVAPEKFHDCSLWFYGPLFLYGPEHSWPNTPNQLEVDLEQKKSKTVLLSSNNTTVSMWGAIDHRNSFQYLQRVVAYVCRFCNNTKPKQAQKRDGQLSVQELEEALLLIVKEAQAQGFQEDLKNLQKTNCVSSNSSLKTLHPFLDEKGLIRVGGRIAEAEVSYDAKHQMLLPYAHDITRLILTDCHMRNFHAGPQTLLSIIRQRFWPVKGKTMARNIVQNCVRCARSRPKLLNQLMGNLPAHRVQPARPFLNSGVDFCGPFWTHFKIRGKRPLKTYVAIFCCFATKAVHIEVVSDLSTESFIGALKRFIGRRGNCQNLYCDNATNFTGARNQLTELQDTIFSEPANSHIKRFCSSKNIEFHFIPPRAPHFGGLWEAAVKSAKHLFLKGIARAALTYEELTTVMVEIEAILNSRPLTPMSDDPNELTALTPGHFLVGEPLTSVVDPHVNPTKGNLIHRWKLVSQLKTEFWNRWTREYLAELQNRKKWHDISRNVQPGQMVIIKEDNMPVLSWPLGRIIQPIPGKDGAVRVADVRTSAGILRRPIHRLAPLPVENNQDKSDKPANDHDTPPSPSRDDDVPKVKRRRRNVFPLTALLTLCLILPTLGAGKVTVTPFKEHPGIYFEGIGSARLISNEWNLVVYFNMTNYWNEFGFIIHASNQLNSLCQRLSTQDICSSTVQEFYIIINEIQEGNLLLMPHRNPRYKRAPLDIIGNIANSLFGVLDSRYAEKMSNIINSIEDKEKQLANLLKNQTSILDATTNIIQRSQEASQRQLQEMGQLINRTMASVNEMQQTLLEHETTQLFDELATKLSLSITNYQRTQSALLGVIIHTHHGKVNPLLLTPKQLQDQLNIIKENMPPHLHLPIKNDHLLEYYNILTIDGRVDLKELIFRLRLPLLTQDSFELLKLTPVPIPVNNTFLTIAVHSAYFIVNLHRELYYPLSSSDLSQCSTPRESTYLCRQHHPLYKKGHEEGSCEFHILTHSFDAASCKLSESISAPRWIQLHASNKLIYVFNTTTTTNVICGDKMEQLVLNSTGLVHLSPGCSIHDQTAIIQSHNLFSSSITTSIIPQGNITTIIQSPKTLRLSYLSEPHHSNISSDIANLKQRINSLRQEEIDVTKAHHHKIHMFSVSYGCAAIIFIFIAYQVWRKYQQPRLPTTVRSVPAAPMTTAI